MKTHKTSKTPDRRKFLVAASLGTAGVAAAVVAGKPAAAPGSDAAREEPQPSGYHASEHIQKYYKTAEV